MYNFARVDADSLVEARSRNCSAKMKSYSVRLLIDTLTGYDITFEVETANVLEYVRVTRGRIVSFTACTKKDKLYLILRRY